MSSSHPDADLHPHATGLAAKMVEEHSKEEPVKLYSGWVSSIAFIHLGLIGFGGELWLQCPG
jgi:hypothetical protein